MIEEGLKLFLFLESREAILSAHDTALRRAKEHPELNVLVASFDAASAPAAPSTTRNTKKPSRPSTATRISVEAKGSFEAAYARNREERERERERTSMWTSGSPASRDSQAATNGGGSLPGHQPSASVGTAAGAAGGAKKGKKKAMKGKTMSLREFL